MYRIASPLLLALLWLVGSGLMLASGHAPLGALLVLIGVTLPVLVIHRAFARREADRERERERASAQRPGHPLLRRSLIFHGCPHPSSSLSLIPLATHAHLTPRHFSCTIDSMPRIAHALLLALSWLLAGGLMLASGMAPLGAMLVLIGATLPVLVIHRAFARREADRERERERARAFGLGLDAWRRLQRSDRLWVALSIAVGIGISTFGMSCRCGVS